MSLTCAVGPCLAPREPGSYYCRNHGPISKWGKPLPKPTNQVNPQLVCPHCQVKGQVRTTRVIVKTGISGGKLTAAVLTGGLSLLAGGLSRKESRTHMTCLNCSTRWLV